MKKRILITLLALALVVAMVIPMAIPVSAANGPPQTYPLVVVPSIPPTSFPFPEVGMTVYVNSANGTFTPHIIHPANGRDNAEESWIEFNELYGSGSGIISFPALGLDMPFLITEGTTFKVTVHVQKNQAIITLQSSAPITVAGVGVDFTTAQIRMITVPPYGLEVIHVN